MIKRESIQKLYDLSDEVENQKELASELLRTAQDRYGDRVQKGVPRPDGTKVDLKEKVMWDEVFYLGHGCESAERLKKLHPEVFKAYKKQDTLAEEMKVFCINEVGVDYTRMTLSDYLKITEALIDLKLSEQNK